jgi:dolichyl-phosphate-mannose--protein O-mannosyl transferase
MTYIFAKALFKDRRVAIAASLLMMFEFMHFTIGRTASIDPFVTLFLVVEYFFLYRYVEARKFGANFHSVLRYLLPAAVSFGLALSCKWNALYSAPFILCILIYGELIKQKFTAAELTKNILNLALLFILLPLTIYLLVYIPYSLIFHTDDMLRFVYDTQKAILDFNLHGLTFATHPYASNWWSWPLDKMPLSVYYWSNDTGLSSSVALLGNPAVYWLMWVTTVMLGYLWVSDQADFSAGFLFLAICAQYLPYALIARISFIYYFYSVTPFLILGISYFIYLAYRTEKLVQRYAVYVYLLVNIALFALFFSSLAGLEVPRSYTLHWLRWMDSWNF